MLVKSLIAACTIGVILTLASANPIYEEQEVLGNGNTKQPLKVEQLQDISVGPQGGEDVEVELKGVFDYHPGNIRRQYSKDKNRVKQGKQKWKNGAKSFVRNF